MSLREYQVRIIILAVVFCLVLWLFWIVRAGLYPFVLGIILAYLLNPFILFFERCGWKRVWALLAVYGVIIGVFFFVGLKFIPFLIRELEYFARDLPEIIKRLEEISCYWQNSYQNIALPVSMRNAINESILSLSAQLNLFVSDLVQRILSLFTYVVGIIISPVLAFYLLNDWQMIRQKLLNMVPRGRQKEVYLFCRDVNMVLHGVIRGQVFISILVGTLITIGLWLLGIRYALLIGILAGVLDIIPYFGAIIGAIPAVATAFLYSPLMAMKVLLLFFLVHQLESVLIQPKVIGEKIGLNPLSVIFFVFIGGELGGFLWMLLCVPIAAIGKVCIQHLFKRFV